MLIAGPGKKKNWYFLPEDYARYIFADENHEIWQKNGAENRMSYMA
jgi:hypothetical protein